MSAVLINFGELKNNGKKENGIDGYDQTEEKRSEETEVQGRGIAQIDRYTRGTENSSVKESRCEGREVRAESEEAGIVRGERADGEEEKGVGDDEKGGRHSDEEGF